MPRRWIRLSLPPPPAGEGHLLVDALRRIGARSVEAAGGRVVAFLPPCDEADALLAEARAAVRASTSLRDVELEWRHARPGEGLRPDDAEPLLVGGRLAVLPPGASVPDGRLPIWLERGAAFGTAEHPTTRACLELLERLVVAGQRLIDVGAGTGILSIAAARLGAVHVAAWEIDPLSCAELRANLHRNGLVERIGVRRGAATAGRLRRAGRAHGIVANVEFGVLQPLLPAFAGALCAEGWLLLSGVIRPERTPLIEAAANAGLTLRSERFDDGWWTGVLRRDPAGEMPGA